MNGLLSKVRSRWRVNPQRQFTDHSRRRIKNVFGDDQRVPLAEEDQALLGDFYPGFDAIGVNESGTALMLVSETAFIVIPTAKGVIETGLMVAELAASGNAENLPMIGGFLFSQDEASRILSLPEKERGEALLDQHQRNLKPLNSSVVVRAASDAGVAVPNLTA